MRTARVAILALLLAPAAAEAQNSIHSILGIGFPGRAHSPRARALGGGWSVLDRTSAVNPATVAEITALSVNTSFATTFREYTALGTRATGLRETRFPFAMVGGGVGRLPLSFAVSYSIYAERSFDIRLTDTVTIASAPTEVMDELSADGGVVDVRGALGWRLSPTVYLGAAVHRITGSTRAKARRDFVGSELRDFADETIVSFAGYGVSAGLHVMSADRRVRVGVAGRYDARLTSEVAGGSTQEVSLPVSLDGGVSLVLTDALRWSASGTWKSWSRAEETDANAFDIWGVGSGFEVGSLTTKFPLRVGARYGTLPFSATEDQPTEWALTAGTGTRLASNRALIDATVERIMRDGGGATERVWYVSVGITIIP